MEPYMSPGFYGDQEQQDTPAMPEETLLPEEDEDGFMLSEEEDEEGNVDEELEEELEEDEQVPSHQSPSTFPLTGLMCRI